MRYMIIANDGWEDLRYTFDDFTEASTQYDVIKKNCTEGESVMLIKFELMDSYAAPGDNLGNDLDLIGTS